jgi:hypothetical protein
VLPVSICTVSPLTEYAKDLPPSRWKTSPE